MTGRQDVTKPTSESDFDHERAQYPARLPDQHVGTCVYEQKYRLRSASMRSKPHDDEIIARRVSSEGYPSKSGG